MYGLRGGFLAWMLHFAPTRLLLLFIVLSSLALALTPEKARYHDAKEAPVQQTSIRSASASSTRFTLRHVFHHGTYNHPRLHRKLDINRNKVELQASDGSRTSNWNSRQYVARSRPTEIQRLKDRGHSVIARMLVGARQYGYPVNPTMYAWTVDSIIGPNVTDKETVLTMAYMANNAYSENETSSDWVDIGGDFNRSLNFGFDRDGLRGHVFANEDNSTIVIGIKGTTTSPFDTGGTGTNDKINDNLFGSCCCGQQGQLMWRQVCDCAASTFTCNNTCIVESLREENRYYAAAMEIFTNATALYPDSNVWLTGHSLGGTVMSLLGLTYGVPTVTFEAIPDALAAARLGLPVPPGSIGGAPQTRSLTGAYHIGHTADPVYMGVCNGATSSCSMFGYAFESQCHTGTRCVYDVVGDKGWSVSIRTHSLRSVIDDVIKQYDTVPECEPEPECQDCFNWNFFQSNHTNSTTSKSSSSTKTRTRTETCKTPGWWGCLDESTTTTKTTTTTSTTTTTDSTPTCKTPGWFGCNDPTTKPPVAGAQVAVVAKTACPTYSSLSDT